jgi:hypothetical protein
VVAFDEPLLEVLSESEALLVALEALSDADDAVELAASVGSEIAESSKAMEASEVVR